MSGGDEAGAVDQIRFLVRAESRVSVVEHLAESGPTTRRELRKRLDASRTTVARAVRSLEEQGWVESGDGTYRLTPTGRVVAAAFTDMLDAVRSTEDLAGFLRWFPADESTPDFVEVTDAEVTTTTDADPYAPARKQAEILHAADRLRILLPSIDLEGTRAISEQVTAGNLQAETVISPGLEATVESGEFAPLVREKVATGRSTMLVAEREPPFYLGLADGGRVQVGVEDDEGFPRALLETTDDGVREWAEGVYEEYRAGARRKPAEEF